MIRPIAERMRIALLALGSKHARHGRHGVAALYPMPSEAATEILCRCGERGIEVTDLELAMVPWRSGQWRAGSGRTLLRWMRATGSPRWRP